MHARLLGTGLVVLTLVAGCSSEVEGPSVLPRVTASPSPSPSAAEVVVVPTAARAATPQGAAAFARFFYAEVRRAFAAKDPEVVRRLSAPGCVACSRFVMSLTKLRDERGHVSDVRYDIKVAEAPATQGATARVTVIYDSPAIEGRDANGAVVRREPAVQDFEEQMDLVRTQNGWLVQELRAV